MKRDNEIILQSLGAAGTVTGSKHILRTPELNILIDCSLENKSDYSRPFGYYAGKTC